MPASKQEPLNKRGGIGRLSRTGAYKAKKLYNRKKVVGVKKAVDAALTKSKTIGGAGNGGSRTVAVTKSPRFYPTEDAPVKVGSHKGNKTAALRGSISAGTILILVSGRFRGKRVVFLEQLASGLLLVTGPYGVNGVPLKRVDQCYVIATSQKVDLGSFKLPAGVNDAFFARPAGSKKPKGEFFEEKQEAPKVVDPKKKEVQTAVDGAITKAIEATPMLKDYMRALFTLRKGQFPHEMKF